MSDLMKTLNDLPPLEDVIQTFKAEKIQIFNAYDYGQICESAAILLDAYINENLLMMYDPKFHDNLFDSLYSLLELQFANLYNYDIEKELCAIIDDVISNYFKLIIPKRSSKNFYSIQNPNYKKSQEKIRIIESRPQPDQRTDEWYVFRHNLITASSAWKDRYTILTKPTTYEKCCPLDLSKFKFSSTDSPLHCNKNMKMFPFNTMKIYQAKVKDYGCIQHDKYPFLGASPDGINVKKPQFIWQNA